jgi:hypothetical protein
MAPVAVVRDKLRRVAGELVIAIVAERSLVVLTREKRSVAIALVIAAAC